MIIFDCGSCLLPQADEKVIKNVLNDENEFNARIFQFPTSAIKLNGKKINYFEFLSSMQDENCNKALQHVVPGVDIDKFNDFIDETPYISGLQKEFYKTYIKARYEKLLLPVYKKLNADF